MKQRLPQAAIGHSPLVVAFGLGVRISSGRNRPLRIVGDLIIAFGALGVLAPMHIRLKRSLAD